MARTPNGARRQGTSFWGILGRVLLGIVAVFAIRLLAGYIGSGGKLDDPAPSNPKRFDQLITAYTAEHPESAHMYDSLRTEFPEEYKALGDGVNERLDRHASRKEMEAFIFTYMRRFSVRHTTDLMQAPSPQLAAVRHTQTLVLEALLQDSVKLCAAFGDSGLPQGARPNANSMRAMASAADAQIDAVVAGHKHPTPHGAVRPSDWAALSQAMDAQGLTQSQRVMLSNGGFASAPDGDKCDIVNIISRAEESLPASVADRITVEQHRAVAEQFKAEDEKAAKGS